MGVGTGFEQAVQLLATIVDPDGSGDSTTCFALVLGVTADRVLLESSRGHAKGDSFGLRFFLPCDGSFTRVSMKCVVDECDDEKLQYEVAITEIDDDSRRVVAGYVSPREIETARERS